MKKFLKSLVLLLVALIVPTAATAAYDQLADGVYREGSTLYITSGVASLGPLQVNPSVIYSFAAAPPVCDANTFTGYSAILHMPATSYGAYFTADYWYNFPYMYNDAVEPTGVAISDDEAELVIGDIIDLSATVTPNNASLRVVEWTSTNPQVATVEDGIVSAVAAGECDIVASCLDKQAVCHVTVHGPISVSLDQNEVTIEQTYQITLTATVSPEGASNQAVVWSTTDASIATVDNGVVTGVGIGECDIIASCLDKQAVCHVTVIEATIHILLNMQEVKLLPNHALILTPTIFPFTTELRVSSTNPTVAATRLVNGAVHVVGLAEGTTKIVVSSVNGEAVPDTCVVTVYTELGDVNCDGYVNIGDVSVLIDHLLGSDIPSFKQGNADTNKDNIINISDVTMLIDYLLSAVDINPPVTESFTVNGVTFTMIAVEGGSFMMGATEEQGSDAWSNEMPAHEVTLSSFSMGETEVSQALWQAVMGSNPSFFSPTNGYFNNLSRPVEQVSWDDCQEFITKLNEMTGRTFRLPTEAEWEFAARGGKNGKGYKYAGSNSISDVAWYRANIPSQSVGTPGYGTQAVATKSSNELGLYDMSGNVWEWCQDFYGYNYYSISPSVNPMGPTSGSSRVNRGGGWGSDSAWYCRVSIRYYYSSTYSDAFLGLRLAL